MIINALESFSASSNLFALKYLNNCSVNLGGGSNNWVIYDTERNKQNKTQNRIYVDLNDTESTQSSHYIDIVSNGFKVQSDDGNLLNRYSSSHVYFYMAFAEHPLKYARAH